MHTVAQVPVSQNNCSSASCSCGKSELVQFASIQTSASLNKIYVTPPQLPWDQRDLKVFMDLGPCDVSQAGQQLDLEMVEGTQVYDKLKICLYIVNGWMGGAIVRYTSDVGVSA
ncbi:uncharacterized protein EDB91DRAFT_1339939 [Suillus paluster]|uniref:uncharacterized protein n=1 Tax=Suillus paluster TaxID=48578 RepID=UPI001B872D03|nr:uncharacterized protein EDB91DRAFT_1339939 [Suillus paluster]KAG1725154.1 hypothetical protein EDB91DRAFT_1339939 [Suillus paluster]